MERGTIDAWASLARALLPLALVAAAAVTAGAAPDGGVASGASGELTIVMVRGGSLTRVRIESGRLVARNAAGATVGDRALAPADHQRLLAAAQRCADDPRPRRGCSTEDTFVAVTVGGRTNSSVLCGDQDSPASGAERWLALVALLRSLMQVRG